VKSSEAAFDVDQTIDARPCYLEYFVGGENEQISGSQIRCRGGNFPITSRRSRDA
jgi:hypothetical protein